VVVNLDSLIYPNDKIPFPTITVCDKDNQPNIYNLVSKILNNVDYMCFDDDKKRLVKTILFHTQTQKVTF